MPSPLPRRHALVWRRAVALLAAVLVLLVVPVGRSPEAGADVAQWRVAPDGRGDCAETPCGTIDAAYQLAQPGDLHDPQSVSGSYLVTASILRI